MSLEVSTSKLASSTPSASGGSKIPIHLLVPLICLLVFVLLLLAGIVVFLRRRAVVLATLAKEDMPRPMSASSIDASAVKTSMIPTLQSPADSESVFIPADLPFIGEKGTDIRANAMHAREGQPTPSGDVPTGGCVADGCHTDTSRSTSESSGEVAHTPPLHANAVAVNAVKNSVDATPPVCPGPESDGAYQPSPRPVTQPVPEDDYDWDALGFIASPSIEELFSNPSTSMGDDTPPTLDRDSDGNETEASVSTPKLESPKSPEVVYKPYDWKSRGFTPTPSLEDLFFNPTAPRIEDKSVILDSDSDNDEADYSVTEPAAAHSLEDSETVISTEAIKQSDIRASDSVSGEHDEASEETSAKCIQDFVSTSTLSSASQEFQERLPWVLLESPSSSSNHTSTQVLLVSSAMTQAKIPPSSSNAKCTKTTVKGKRTSIGSPTFAPTKMSRPMKSSDRFPSSSSRPVTTRMISKHRTTSPNISSPRSLTPTKKFEYPSPPTSPPLRHPPTTRAGPQVVKASRFSARISKLSTDSGSTSPHSIVSGSGIPLSLGRKSTTNSNDPLSTKSVLSTPPPTRKSTKAERTTPPTGRRMSTTIGSPSGHSPTPTKTPMKRPQTNRPSVRAGLPIATKPPVTCSRHTAAYSARLSPSRPQGGTTASSSGPSLPLRTTDSPKRLRGPLGSISNVDGVSRKS